MVNYEYNPWGEVISTTGSMADTIGQKNPIRYRGYYYDAESGFYYLNSRYYDPVTCRFVSADSAVSGNGESVQGYNLFAYCFNNPINMSDETGNWPKLLEKVAKVVAAAAVVVAAVALVSVVTAGTGGIALTVATTAFGTACGGFVGGIANEKKGESFINGWVGGAVNGFVQSLGTKYIRGTGTIVGGGFGSAAGTAITESLNNRGKPKERQKSSKVILNDSLKSAAIGTVMSTMTAGINYAVNNAVDTQAGGLMPEMTCGFGEMVKGFFGSVDDSLVYIFCEE